MSLPGDGFRAIPELSRRIMSRMLRGISRTFLRNNTLTATKSKVSGCRNILRIHSVSRTSHRLVVGSRNRSMVGPPASLHEVSEMLHSFESSRRAYMTIDASFVGLPKKSNACPSSGMPQGAFGGFVRSGWYRRDVVVRRRRLEATKNPTSHRMHTNQESPEIKSNGWYSMTISSSHSNCLRSNGKKSLRYNASMYCPAVPLRSRQSKDTS
jgi:hypothetical protein